DHCRGGLTASRQCSVWAWHRPQHRWDISIANLLNRPRQFTPGSSAVFRISGRDDFLVDVEQVGQIVPVIDRILEDGYVGHASQRSRGKTVSVPSIAKQTAKSLAYKFLMFLNIFLAPTRCRDSTNGEPAWTSRTRRLLFPNRIA